MNATNARSEWLAAVAAHAGCDEEKVEQVLGTRRIHPAPVAGSPRRLLLRKIAFQGTKVGIPKSGPFEFEWPKLDRGLWAMLTDDNLKGKSSVIEVVRWLLRGRPSDNLQDDVRGWISSAALHFCLDDFLYEVRVEDAASVRGALFRNEADGRVRQLAPFASDDEFENVMSDFFMKEFALETVTNWNSGKTEDDTGRAVVHGWPALSGVMFIGTDYTCLLGEIPPTSGVTTPLMRMYLGLPWISTLTAAKTVRQSIKRDNDARQRRWKVGQEARAGRILTLQREIEAKKKELAAMHSDEEVRAALAQATVRLREAIGAERAMEERLQREKVSVAEGQTAYGEDRQQLQAHIDSEAAGAVFRQLDPSCCPRCEAMIAAERKQQERAQHLCSVCGEHLKSDVDATAVRAQLEAQVNASRKALDKAARALGEAETSLALIRANKDAADAEITTLTVKLSDFDARGKLIVEIAALEGRLAEASREPNSETDANDDAPVVDAVVAVTEELVKNAQADLLEKVSERIVAYARRFGMENLNDAELKGNVQLRLTKGGESTSYSKVTLGEKLRLKVAAVLAMISVAEAEGVGRHPGLLMIDSPGAQEISRKDLDELAAGLEQVSREFGHLQVFVAALASPAITSHVPPERRLHAHRDDPLW